jgi:hypothetical protein
MTDKRKVSTDALETLGTIIGPYEKRDAIHLAVIPVIARQDLKAGDDVGINGTHENPIGIVDPFINRSRYDCSKRIDMGERFWLVIYPRKINSLRHVWTHPDIPDDEAYAINSLGANLSEIKKSKKWIEEWIETMNENYDSSIYDHDASTNYEEIMETAHAHLNDHDGVNPNAILTHGAFFERYTIPEEFWTHFEIITGKSVPTDKKRSFFSCGC